MITITVGMLFSWRIVIQSTISRSYLVAF